jgi:dTMP kinase
VSGLFISLEGGEGSGKTTQLRRLARHLETNGLSVVSTREPGGTLLGETVRALLVRESPDPPDPLAELLLYEADRAHHVATLIRPALQAGHVVLCDRYADATEAYQGWGRSLPLPVIRTASELATGGVWPQRTLLLDLPPELGIRRALARSGTSDGRGEERFEAEDLSFHRRVREGYLSIARAHPERVRVVDASGSPEETFRALWGGVRDLFPQLA